MPKIGDKLYVPDRWFIDRGQDDTCGGLATISGLKVMGGTTFIGFIELPGVGLNAEYVMESQEDWATTYAGRIAHPCPDFG